MFQSRHKLAVMIGLMHAQMTEGGVAGRGGVNVDTNPLSSPISAQVSTKLVDLVDTSFHFRADKELKKEVGDAAKRPTFKTPIPYLTKAGLMAVLTADDKSTALALEACNDVIINRARGIINELVESDSFDKTKKTFGKTLTSADLDLEKLSFLAIALLPKSERGAGIPKEAFAAFVADYKETMQKPAAIALLPDRKPRTPEVLDKHGIILGGKFNQVRSRKDVIGQMLGFLDIWMQVTENADEHATVYEHLVAKGKLLMEGESFEDL